MSSESIENDLAVLKSMGDWKESPKAFTRFVAKRTREYGLWPDESPYGIRTGWEVGEGKRPCETTKLEIRIYANQRAVKRGLPMQRVEFLK